MSVNNNSANIVNMNDERARREAGELPLGEFDHIGAALRATREAAGFSIADIESQIHIKEKT